jgi:GxxExxY protein
MAPPSHVDTLTRQIIGAGIEVHRNLGPGLLESTYMPCMQLELSTAGLSFVAQRPVPIFYKGLQLDAKYRIDLLVEDLVVVELKSVDHVLPVYHAQVLTYMRLLKCPAGLLINFNVLKLIDGVKRLINPDACERQRPDGHAGRPANGSPSWSLTSLFELLFPGPSCRPLRRPAASPARASSSSSQ